MDLKRYLIVNADDFGQSAGVNQGIIEAHEHGIVTSASLMVRWPAASAAVAYAQVHPELSLGLHLDLSEWVYRNDTWLPLYEVVSLDDATAVAEEVSRQLATFRSLTGRDPTHIDSHQHAHRQEPVRSIAVDLARKLDVPLRHFSANIRYEGSFYGQADNGYPYPEGIGVENLLNMLVELPTGMTELGCHPGYADDLDTMYRSERALEVKTLCDPQVQTAILSLRIELRSFNKECVNAASDGRFQ